MRKSVKNAEDGHGADDKIKALKEQRGNFCPDQSRRHPAASVGDVRLALAHGQRFMVIPTQWGVRYDHQEPMPMNYDQPYVAD